MSAPNCPYPTCDDSIEHSPIMCKYIRAWCIVCQRWGHLAKHHEIPGLPPPYLWFLFLHYQSINLDTSYMMKDKKHENSFFSHVHSLRTTSVKITQSRFQNQGWSRQARSYSLSTSGRSFIPTVSGYTACQANDKPFVLLSKHCPRPLPLSCWDVTSYKLQTAIALAERVSNQTRS